MSSSLAERLKVETRPAHVLAERSAFMGALLRGRLNRAAYCALLRNLHAIYAALEPALRRHAEHPLVAPIYLPALWRSEVLADDLRVLHGDAWASAIGVQAAAETYVERLVWLADTRPRLLLSHAYVRYLGDLSGGQMLRRIVAASLAPPKGSGTRFYEFGDADETRALTQALRHGIDCVAVDAETETALVDEALFSFKLHQQLFEALGQACGVSGDEPMRVRTAAG